MDIKQIKLLVKRGESTTVEFKKSTALLRSVCETLCAFLNSKGGTVFVGVNDKGQLIGQDVTNNTRHEIARELAKIEPHVDIDVDYLAIENNKQIIIFNVKAGMDAPYSYDDRPYLRSQSTTKRMPREKYDELVHDKKSILMPWEKLTNNDLSMADLDKARIRQVVTIAIKERRLTEVAARATIPEILKKFNLIINNKLTNAAVVLFCKNEHKQFIQSQLKLARFKGVNKREFIDNKAMQGNIFDLYESGMRFLQNYLPIAGKVVAGSPFRVETPAIPYEVLRETLVNALCHRDYSSYSGSISVAIYDDMVEISNFGCLPKIISLKDLSKKHASHPRNPLIASVLYACTMIERWGRGTQDIIDFCKQAGNPKPTFEETAGNFTVILPLKESIGGRQTKKSNELTTRQAEILELLRKSSLNGAEIAEKLPDNPSVRAIQKNLAKLEKAGIIRRTGKARAIIWSIVK